MTPILDRRGGANEAAPKVQTNECRGGGIKEKINKNTEKTSFSLPKKYLFEPNNAIMKSGGFDEISIYFTIEKLHQHSHLYTSTN